MYIKVQDSIPHKSKTAIEPFQLDFHLKEKGKLICATKLTCTTVKTPSRTTANRNRLLILGVSGCASIPDNQA
jgi:hypothetical protein